MKKRTILILSLTALFFLISSLLHHFTKNSGFEIAGLNENFFSGFFLGLGITCPVLLITREDEHWIWCLIKGTAKEQSTTIISIENEWPAM